MYIIWTLFREDIPLSLECCKDHRLTTLLLLPKLRIDQENCIEEIQMTDEGGYNLFQSTDLNPNCFPPFKDLFQNNA